MTTHSLKPRDFLAPFLIACAIFFLFIKGPGLGDDFQYWRIGFLVHQDGLAGWDAKSFHNLRWPVWGLCWLLQGVFGLNSVAYYGVPLIYLLVATGIVYTLARGILGSPRLGLGAVLLFLCHPLLDPVIHRPMPDLPEGTLIGLAVLLWLGLVRSERNSVRLLWALGIGIVSGLLFANRITGVFVFGVLAPVAAVTAWKNERFSWKQALLWLGVAGATFLAFISLEGLVYKQLTGDFFHAITANLGAKGRKGTDSIALYKFPFRFLGVLWKSGHMAPVYCLASLAGVVALWKTPGRLGKVVVVWVVSLYLAYSCSLQSLFPPRPLLRDADRFLVSLSLPLSIMTAAGGLWVLRELTRFARLSFLKNRALQGTSGFAVFAVVLLTLIVTTGRRTFTNFGFLPELSHYLDALPDGTRIFTHRAMKAAAFLSNSRQAGKMEWYAPASIFNHKERHETEADEADEFWYCRKISWLGTRKKLEQNIETQEQLGSYFEDPQKEWSLQRAIEVGGVPEFILYSRRKADDPPQTKLALKEVIPSAPPLPFHWKRPENGKKRIQEWFDFPIPEAVRGKALQAYLTARSGSVQSVRVTLIFYSEKKEVGTLEFRPYFHPTSSIDFHTFEVPPEATHATASLVFPPKGQDIVIEELSFTLSPISTR